MAKYKSYFLYLNFLELLYIVNIINGCFSLFMEQMDISSSITQVTRDEEDNYSLRDEGEFGKVFKKGSVAHDKVNIHTQDRMVFRWSRPELNK